MKASEAKPLNKEELLTWRTFPAMGAVLSSYWDGVRTKLFEWLSKVRLNDAEETAKRIAQSGEVEL